MSARGGFTLMEIMVTLAVLAGSLVIIMSGFFNAMNLHDNAITEVRFRGLFDKAIGEAEVRVLSGELAGSEEFGPRFEGHTYSWQALPVAEEEEADAVQLYEVVVTVTPPEDVSEPRELRFLVYNMNGQTLGEDGPGGRGPGRSTTQGRGLFN